MNSQSPTSLRKRRPALVAAMALGLLVVAFALAPSASAHEQIVSAGPVTVEITHQTGPNGEECHYESVYLQGLLVTRLGLANPPGCPNW